MRSYLKNFACTDWNSSEKIQIVLNTSCMHNIGKNNGKFGASWKYFLNETKKKNNNNCQWAEKFQKSRWLIL